MSWLYSQALVEEYLGENFLDGEQSAPLNGNLTPQAYCAPDKMMDFSRLSRFGMTFKPLTENLGQELLTLYLEDFHVPTFRQQEKGQEFMEKPLECGEKWHASFTKYDPNSSLWRTHQCSLLGDLDEFLETWPRWGLMQNGECWEHQTLERSMKGSESGLLPDNQNFFHTPNTTGLDGGSNSRKALKKRISTWPTPTTPTGGGNVGGSGAYKNAIKNGTHIPHSINPSLYEWLMGWPIGWTDLKPLEMDKSHFALQQHGES